MSKPLIPAEAWTILRDQAATAEDLERASAILAPIAAAVRQSSQSDPSDLVYEAIRLLLAQRHRLEAQDRELSMLVGFTELLLEGVRRELPGAHPCRRAFECAWLSFESSEFKPNLRAFRGAMSAFRRLDAWTQRKIAAGWRLDPDVPDLDSMLDWRARAEGPAELAVRDELVIDGGFYQPGEIHFRRVWSLLHHEENPVRLHVRAGISQGDVIAFLESALHIVREAFAIATAIPPQLASEATSRTAQKKGQAPNGDACPGGGATHRQHVGALAG